MTTAADEPWVVVVGAGPAGIMAAQAALRGGCRVSLLDEAPRPGGRSQDQARLLRPFAEIEGEIDYRPQSTAQSLRAGPRLWLAGDRAELRPDAVILATGLSETAIPFPGWTLSGVQSAGGLLLGAELAQWLPGKRAVVAGLGPLPVLAAAQLLEAGTDVAAVALFHSFKWLALDPLGLWAGRHELREGLAALGRLRRAGVEILTGWAPLRAGGADRLERVHLGPHFGTGVADPERSRVFEADLLAVNYGFGANSELALMAGAEVRYFGPRGGWLPLADAFGRSGVKGLYIAGDCGGLLGARGAEAEGRIVGAAAAADLRQNGLPDLAAAQAQRSRQLRFQRALLPLFDLPSAVWEWPRKETEICPCAGVTKGRIEKALAEGHSTLEDIGHNTGAGLGHCGGRICLQALAALASAGKPGPDTAPLRTSYNHSER